MTLLERNLRALARRWPALAEELAVVEPSPDVEIAAARSGAPTARYGGQLLHSLFDPAREAERLVAQTCAGPCTAAVVLGFGLGYACEAALRLLSGRPILAIEPDPALFVRALSARPLEPLLADPRLVLVVSSDASRLESALEKAAAEERLALGSPCLLRLRPAGSRNAAFYARVERILVAARDRSRVNLDTLQRFGPLWVRNLLRNLEMALPAAGVESLAGLFEDLPAVVLASGPSLDEVMPHVGELAERCLVVAVDTSLRACLQRGLEPDFVVVIDPQYWNSRHLDGTCAPRTALVAESSTCPRALRLAPRRAFFMSSFFPLGRLVESYAGRKGDLAAGGSVATTAWDLARRVGARPIIMAGLDLGYPGRATHFRGAFFEQRFLALSRRTEPAEHHAFAYLAGADPFLAPSAGGGTVLTDRRMAVYRSWFETQVRQHPEARTVSLSSRGVAIAGIDRASLEEVLALPRRRDEIAARMARAAAGPAKEPDWRGLCEGLARLRDDVAAAAEIARQAIAAAQRASSAPSSALAELDRLDARMLALGSRDVLSFLMQPIITRVEQEGSTGDPLERTREIYEQIERSAEFHHRLLGETLKRLESRALKPKRGAADS